MECQKTALFALTLAAGSAQYGMLGWTSLFVSNLEALLSCLLASSIAVENSDVILALSLLHLALEPFRSSLYPRVLQFHKAAHLTITCARNRGTLSTHRCPSLHSAVLLLL